MPKPIKTDGKEERERVIMRGNGAERGWERGGKSERASWRGAGWKEKARREKKKMECTKADSC